MNRPVPIPPDYGRACLTNLVPGLAARRANGGAGAPEWFPKGVDDAPRIVMVVLDGLGWNQLQLNADVAPVLSALGGGCITSVAPTTTACALTSISTGVTPGRHGLVGYRLAMDGGIFNVLLWRRDGIDLRMSHPAPQIQPLGTFAGLGTPVPVITKQEFAATGFTAAHLGDVRIVGWRAHSSIPILVERQLNTGSPFIYVYYDGIDKIAHACGLGAEYRAELASADRMVGDIVAGVPGDVAVVVTADHGQVEVGSSVEVLGPDLMDHTALISGEGRFRWLHVHEGRRDEVAKIAEELYNEIAWVATRDQVIDEGWLGPEVTDLTRSRLGDVALVPFADTAFFDPADVGEQRLVARHGSLTDAEMLVPLLAYPHR